MKSFYVIYRTGGTANFQWRHTVAFSFAPACLKRREVEQMGYEAYVREVSFVKRHGLPTTYEWTDSYAFENES